MTVDVRGRLSAAIIDVLPERGAASYLSALEITSHLRKSRVDTTSIHSVLASMKKRGKILARKNRLTKRLEYARKG
jgi:histidinol dehydrogenase